jgi:2-polyprenyl-3-methyl-5-hydroxy-6-metoxy-1,4-benzoquinol methylase
MKKLSEKQYWDLSYRQKLSACQPAESENLRPKKIIDELLRATPFRGYADYLLWESIYPKYLSGMKGAKVIEIGSAPGIELVRLHKVFGMEPYGIEYSEAGVELNRRIFNANRLKPENIIHANFLGCKIEKRFESCFDVVVSNGFIEHFDNPKEVVDKHINLLKKGGLLIISIPNLRGFNYAMQYFFQHSVLKIHNFGIMEKSEFAKLFDDQRLSQQYCGYYGTLNFNLYAAKKGTIGDFLLTLTKIMQLLLNVIFRILLGKRGAESKTFSPYLIYIGVRK